MTLDPDSRRGVRTALRRVFGARDPDRKDPAPVVEGAPPAQTDQATVQVMAHTLIADLFGAGLRLQAVRRRAPVELHQELDEITDHIDRVVRDVRDYAFLHRPTQQQPTVDESD